MLPAHLRGWKVAAVGAALFAGIGLTVGPRPGHADPAPAPVRSAPALSLPDVRTGKPVALNSFKDRKAVVVAFVGTACPISNLYLTRLAELHKAYADRGVQFLAVNANRRDTAEEVAAHARKYAVPFPVLKDADAKLADLLKAERTPEAVLLDAKGVVRYRGRIDDQYGIDVRRPKPTKTELIDAIEAVLAGREVAVAKAEVSGCRIARPTKPKTEATVTYAKHVAPILQKNCQECHRPGQIGPMSLLTYEDASAWSATVREAVSDGRMPPWYADPKVGHFVNDRQLPSADRKALLDWIDQGCAEGDPKDAPPPLKFPSEWRIGKPDLILSMDKAFDVPAEAPKYGIPYKYFTIETHFAEDRWVERAEARPGATEVVHHILAFVLPPDNSKEPIPPGPPVLPPATESARRATVLCGTAPGDMVTILPPGQARKIPAGSKIILQLHYTPNGRAQSDRSSIGLIFAKQPPKQRVLSIAVYNERFLIPPGEGNHRVDSWFTFPEDGRILTFMPHMHLRGKSFTCAVRRPGDKEEELVLSVPRFNFQWQMGYRLSKPIAMPKGSKIHCVAHYDNSDKNPNNPDPSKAIRWGDQTWQEMMVGWTDIALNVKPE